MSGRNASVSFLAEVAKSQNQSFHLFEGYWDSGTIYLCDQPRTVTWNGNSYLGVGKFISYDRMEENTDMVIQNVSITLAGAPTDLIAIAMQQNFINRRAVIYYGFFDASLNVIADPLPIFDGLMDGCTLSEDPTKGDASITIAASDYHADFDKAVGRLTNQTSQQFYYPADNSMNLVASIVDKVVNWGGK